jgi:hypothetical protein
MCGIHTGAGGGGGGGGGGTGAATHEFDGASYTVPCPHSTALLTAGSINVTHVSGASAKVMAIAKRRILPIIA